MNQVQPIEQQAKNLLRQLGGEEDEQIKVDYLKICHDGEDKQGRDIKKGYMSLSDQSEAVWTDKIRIHVLAQYFQYREQDEGGKVLNKSILLRDIRRGEPIDMKGGVRCGKPTRKVLNQMDEENKQAWARKVKTTRIIRGTASYTGKTADGKEVEIKNAPFQHYMRGVGYMDFDAVTDSLPFGKQFHDFEIDMRTEKRGKYYNTTFSPDFSSPATINKDVVDTLELFVQQADKENAFVKKRHAEAKMETEAVGEVYDAVATQDLDADLADA